MLADVSSAREVARFLKSFAGPVIYDPVGATSSGTITMDDELLEFVRAELLPLVSLLTPNLPELAALTGLPVTGRDDITAACTQLLSLGVDAVLAKGGPC